MAKTLRLTIIYDDGRIVASIPEVPGAFSQGESRGGARENVIDALHGILQLRFTENARSASVTDSEPLELTIGS